MAISVGNALNRKGIKCKYTIVHTSPVPQLADEFHQIKIPLETESELSTKNYHKSVLYKTLTRLKPDVLLVNHQWFMLYNFINDLKCKKIYLSDHAYDNHFKITRPGEDLIFKNDQYDQVLAIEPFKSCIHMESINPLVVRNRNEVFSREEALKRLGLDGSKKVALYGISGHPEDFEKFWDKYSYLEKEYEVVRLSYNNFLFPVVDYYNAFDLIVCGGGYNNVWAIVYFHKKAIYEPTKLRFSDHETRIKTSKDFTFDVNGADQLADIIMNL